MVADVSTSAPADAEPDPVLRRSPFGDNPVVGPRGQRAQQRILEAALQAFGEVGYYPCSVDRIAAGAGCSRVSFYQYFSGKDDLFHRLAAQVARDVTGSLESLAPVSADAAGWRTLRDWVASYAEIFTSYGSVLSSFQSVAARDPFVSDLRAGAARDSARALRAKVGAAVVDADHLDPIIELVLQCTPRTYRFREILANAAPHAYPRARMEIALTDVLHRTFFGSSPVNSRPDLHPVPPEVGAEPSGLSVPQQPTASPRSAAAQGTIDALSDAGRRVLVREGYAGSRVDDIVTEAGVSRGAFYRYFPNLREFTYSLVVESMAALAAALAPLPALDPASSQDRSTLRAWLRSYGAAHAHEAAIIRVWIDACAHGPILYVDSAPALDWGRRQIERVLGDRGFGDVHSDAVIALAVLESFSAQPASEDSVEAAAQLIERGLLGPGKPSPSAT